MYIRIYTCIYGMTNVCHTESLNVYIHIYMYIYIYGTTKVRHSESLLFPLIWVQGSVTPVAHVSESCRTHEYGTGTSCIHVTCIPAQHCNTHAHTATHCTALQHNCNTLQHTATQCNTLQHTATHYNTPCIHVTHVNVARHLYEYVVLCIKMSHVALIRAWRVIIACATWLIMCIYTHVYMYLYAHIHAWIYMHIWLCI